jgi:formyl-CoA transferase
LIAANQDTVFTRLAKAMGQPELAEDERYATHAARGRHQEELDDIVSAWSARHDGHELTVILEENGVPAGPIYRAPEMLEDEHFKAREAIIRIMHPHFGDLAMQNVVPKLSKTPGQVREPDPTLGQHTEEILKGLLGMSDEEIIQMAEAGVI